MKHFLSLLIMVVIISLWGEWTVVETFSIPEGASGLAWDGENLYCGIYGANGDEFYQIDPADGSYQLIFISPSIGDCFGLTWDGEHLWTTDHPSPSSNPAIALELDLSGNIISQFNLPDHYMSGIAYDNGDFWVSTYYDPDGHIYKLDDQGNILQSFAAPDNQPWDLCLQDDYLWMADYWGDALYKIDPLTGNLIESNPSEGVDPAGIVYDGQYLWYCDNGQGYDQDYLYKVDLGGAGMPVIELGFTEYDFGEVIVGEIGSVDLPIYNNGTAELAIISVLIPSTQFSPVFQPPLLIAPDETGYVGIQFFPDSWGDFSAVMEISSNDPVHPLMEVELSGSGIYEDADIEVSIGSLDFGTVRVNGFTGEPIMISNQGEGNLIIDDLDITGENFQINILDELPVTLETNEEFGFSVWFNPDLAITYTGSLMIFSNDPDENPYEVSLSGTGEQQNFLIGEQIWEYQIDVSYDNSPKAIAAIPDVNGDNKDDVIICSEDDFIRCFNGNSSDWADIIWENELGSVYSQAGLDVTEDIDGDGYSDVFVGTAWGDRTIYLLSGLSGEIIWEHDTHEYGDGGWVYQVRSDHDYNDDGIADVLAAVGNDASGTGPQRAYCLDAVTGSSIWEFYSPGTKFSVLGIADINGDDIPDAIAGATNQYETDGYIYGINGTNGNQMWSYTTSGSSVWAIEQLGDINEDGVADIIAGDFSGNYYAINPVNGNMLWNGSIGTAIILRFVKFNDVNNDGYPDISIAHSSIDNAVMIDGFNGSTIWNQPVADQPWNLSKIDDISGDGINDVIVGTLYSNSFVHYLDGAAGSELCSVNVGTPVDAIGVIHDVDGNGSMEVVAGGRNGWVYCYSGGSVALGTLEGYVYDSSMQPLEGILIQIDGYAVITDVQGYFFIQLPPGVYDLTISMTGYEIYTLNITIIQNETTTIEIILELIEEIIPPQNVAIDEGGLISWDAPAARPLENYNIYLDDDLIAQTEETSYQLIDLVFNTFYSVGVSALYTTGESEVITTGFIYTGFHHFGDIDDNGIVEALDAALSLQFVVGIDPSPYAPLPWEEWQLTVADVDGNTFVEAYDAALILQYVVGIIDVFPAELPLRHAAPAAEVDIRQVDDLLIFSSFQDLFAFSIKFNDAALNINNPKLLIDGALLEYNKDEQHLALASAEALKGDFLQIRLSENIQSLDISLMINTQKQDRIIALKNADSPPAITELQKNYPNPFNPETTINFQIAEGETGELCIFNVKGQILHRSLHYAGYHKHIWKADDFSSGIYFYKLKTKTTCQTRKMILIR